MPLDEPGTDARRLAAAERLSLISSMMTGAVACPVWWCRRSTWTGRPRSPGAEFAYDLFAEKLKSQRHDLEQIDVKLGVVAAILATGAGGALAMTGAACGLRVQKGRNDPDPMTLVKYAGDEPSYMKQLALRSMMKSFGENQDDLENKAWFLNRTIIAAGAVLLLAIAGKAAGIA
jgi:hypothetical protein